MKLKVGDLVYYFFEDIKCYSGVSVITIIREQSGGSVIYVESEDSAVVTGNANYPRDFICHAVPLVKSLFGYNE